MYKRITKLSCLALLLALIGLAGCGDKNALESMATSGGNDTKLEKGLAALDAGNYDDAINLLTPLDDSQLKRKYLASAYLGKAGVDVLQIVTILNKNNENSGGETAKSTFWDVTGQLLGNSSGKIDGPTLAIKKSNVEKALSVLINGSATSAAYKTVAGLNVSDFAAMEDNNLVEAGIAAAIHCILSVTGQMTDGVTFIINPSKVPVSQRTISDVPATFVSDLRVVAAAVDRINSLASDSQGSDDKLTKDFEKFLSEVGYSNDGVVTLTELQNYINGL